MHKIQIVENKTVIEPKREHPLPLCKLYVAVDHYTRDRRIFHKVISPFVDTTISKLYGFIRKKKVASVSVYDGEA